MHKDKVNHWREWLYDQEMTDIDMLQLLDAIVLDLVDMWDKKQVKDLLKGTLREVENHE